MRLKDKEEPVTGRAREEHWGDGTVRAEALRWECVFGGGDQQGGRCGWSRVEGREVVRAGRPHRG